MRRRTLALVAAAIAHGLAWTVSIWLAVGPVYQGVSATAGVPGGPLPGEQTHFTRSLVEQNGLWVLYLLAVPLALTGLGLLVVWKAPGKRAWRALSLWVPALLLFLGCGLAIWSIGLFYLPSALALFAAAAITTFQRHAPARTE